eukprot:122953-Chlamydomonas_euryale.AAC.2
MPRSSLHATSAHGRLSPAAVDTATSISAAARNDSSELQSKRNAATSARVRSGIEELSRALPPPPMPPPPPAGAPPEMRCSIMNSLMMSSAISLMTST